MVTGQTERVNIPSKNTYKDTDRTKKFDRGSKYFLLYPNHKKDLDMQDFKW